MPKRRARLVPSHKPYAPSRNDERNDESCLLCGDPIVPWPARWCELIGDGERVTGFAHARCIHEYRFFAAQMPLAASLQTPVF